MEFLALQRKLEADNVRWFGVDWKKIPLWYWALALAGEAGEMCNLVKKQLRDGTDTKQAVADELADIVIYALLQASVMGIDLEAAVLRKCEKIDYRNMKGVVNLLQD